MDSSCCCVEFCRQSPTGKVPLPRSGHVFLFVPFLGGILCHGGLGRSDIDYYNDTWLLKEDTGNWEDMTMLIRGAPPPKAFGQAGVVLRHGASVLFYGGLGDREEHFDSFVLLDLQAMEWKRVDVRGSHFPPKMWGMSMVLMRSADSAPRDLIVMFGGMEGSEPHNTVYCVTPDTWEVSPLELQDPQVAPHPRRRHGAAVYRDHFMFIFSGRDLRNFFNDLWMLNMLTRQWVPFSLSMPLSLHRLIFSQPRNHMIAKQVHAAYRAKIGQMNRRQRGAALNSFFSTAMSRTGVSMIIVQDTLIMFGGFSYDAFSNTVTSLADMHAYIIPRHEWRPVTQRQSVPQVTAASPSAVAALLEHNTPPPCTMSGLAECFRSGSFSLFGGRVGDDPIDNLYSFKLDLPKVPLTCLAWEWLRETAAVTAFPASDDRRLRERLPSILLEGCKKQEHQYTPVDFKPA